MKKSRRYFKELRFRQLRAMVELDKCGSFTGVAANLGLSVPSVWQQVRALESEFGVTLVNTHGPKAGLTQHGRLLVDLSSPLVQGFDSIRQIFADQSAKVSRQLVVASTASLLLHELREPLDAYRKRFPEVHISFIDRPSTIARRHMEDGEADIAIVGQLTPTPSAVLETTPLTAYPFKLVCPEGHPLAKVRKINLETLLKYPLLLTGEASNSRRRVDAIFDAAGLKEKLNVVLGASSFDLLAGYVKMGFGISITSISSMIVAAAAAGSEAYRGLVFRDVASIFGEEEVVILHRKNRYELPHHSEFRAILKSTQKPHRNSR